MKLMRFFHRPRYFDGNISRGFAALYSGKAIGMVAAGLWGVFLPIFLFQLFNGHFQYTMSYFVIGHLLYATFVALSTKALNWFGFRRALRASVLVGSAFYLIFGLAAGRSLTVIIPVSLFVLVLYRLLHWVPYHVDFTKFSDPQNRGREVSVMLATAQMFGIFLPIVSGLIINRYGFSALFWLALVISLLSGIPYLAVPRTEERFVWSYRETWRQFFSKTERKTMLALFASGAESFIGLAVWPIFIFQILEGNILRVGAVSTLIIGVTVILQLLLGERIDHRLRKERVLRFGSVGYALGWVFKMFIGTAFQVFIAGAYHGVVRIFTRTPFDALAYDIAADQGHYVDEFTVIREMAINYGKLVMGVLTIVISLAVSLQWVFVLAAIAAVCLNLLRRDKTVISPILPRSVR